jgi:heme exporter protein C
MKKLAPTSIVITLALLAYTSYLGLVVAPTEQTMGDVQRIFYYHVPSGWVAGLCFFLNFLASVIYLWKRSEASDAMAAASAEVGVVFCTVLLITGPLWARPVWGIWWTWDARLTTTLVLWLIYASYLLLRKFADGPQMRTLAAVLAIFGYVDVPIVYYSTTWWRTQHPSPVIGGDGSLDPAMWIAVLWNLAAWLAWGILLAGWRYSVEQRRQIAEQHAALHALEASLEVTL